MACTWLSHGKRPQSFESVISDLNSIAKYNTEQGINSLCQKHTKALSHFLSQLLGAKVIQIPLIIYLVMEDFAVIVKNALFSTLTFVTSGRLCGAISFF